MTEPTRRGRGRPRKQPSDAAATPPRPRRKAPLALPFDGVRAEIVCEIHRLGAPATRAAESAGAADHLPILAATDVAHLPVRVPGVRFQLTATQVAAAQENLEAFARHQVSGLARNSRRTMLADWITWLAFCRQQGCPALPIAFDDLRVFLDAMIAAERKRSTVEHHLYTLRHASAFYGCPDPMESLVAKAYWRDTCRERLTAEKRQAEGLRQDDVEALVGALDLTVPQQARDAALVRMAYDLLARRNELAAARWADLHLPRRGTGFYKVPRSKTDQEGKGTQLALSPATVTALLAWRRYAHPDLPYVFQPMKVRRHRLGPHKGEVIVRPLDAGEIPKIWNRLAAAAGIAGDDRRFGGHSARVGAAQDVTDAGGDLGLLMKLGRWKGPAQPARYGEAGLAERAMETRHELLRRLSDKRGALEALPLDAEHDVREQETP